MGHFWKIPCPSKMFLLPICLLCACKGRERVFPFFLRLAALCMVLLRRFKIFLGRRISGNSVVQVVKRNAAHIPPIHRPSKILNRLSKTMHSAASPRKKGKTLSLPLHAHSKHMGRRNILLGQGIFKKYRIQAKNHISLSR